MIHSTLNSQAGVSQPACCSVPHFDRVNYFYGQLLGAQDFKTEQSFFREKIKLHNRCLHGYGVVCGLRVSPMKPGKPLPPMWNDDETEQQIQDNRRKVAELTKRLADDSLSGREKETLIARRKELQEQLAALESRGPSQPRCPARVLVDCGLALDCAGNELVVRQPLCVDLLQHLDHDERTEMLHQVDANPAGFKPPTLYLRLCYHELPLESTRPVLSEACGAAACQHAKLRDSVCVTVSTKAPPVDQRCETCCEGPCECCVLLAEIHDFVPYQPVKEQQIHNEVRRPVSVYSPTRVKAISWAHGVEYAPNEVDQILHEGLTIEFTAPVLAETVRPGVLDVYYFTGGKQLAGNVQYLAGFLKPGDFEDDCTRKIHFTFDGYERLDPGDRLLIVLRTSFLLDHCCQPVDGEHIGGWVGLTDEGVAPANAEVIQPPNRCRELRGAYGPWSSGNGVVAGNFESWFYVQQEYNGEGKGKLR